VRLGWIREDQIKGKIKRRPTCNAWSAKREREKEENVCEKGEGCARMGGGSKGRKEKIK